LKLEAVRERSGAKLHFEFDKRKYDAESIQRLSEAIACCGSSYGNKGARKSSTAKTSCSSGC
jgi:hypothetical protein